MSNDPQASPTFSPRMRCICPPDGVPGSRPTRARRPRADRRRRARGRRGERSTPTPTRSDVAGSRGRRGDRARRRSGPPLPPADGAGRRSSRARARSRSRSASRKASSPMLRAALIDAARRYAACSTSASACAPARSACASSCATSARGGRPSRATTTRRQRRRFLAQLARLRRLASRARGVLRADGPPPEPGRAGASARRGSRASIERLRGVAARARRWRGARGRAGRSRSCRARRRACRSSGPHPAAQPRAPARRTARAELERRERARRAPRDRATWSARVGMPAAALGRVVADIRRRRDTCARREAGAHRGQPAPRRVDRQALHAPRAAVPRPDPGREHRPHARGRQVRVPARLQVLDLRHVVDPPGDHARHRRPGAHHPHPRPHGRDDQQAAARLAHAGAGARTRADARGDRRAHGAVARQGAARRCASRREPISLETPVGEDEDSHLGDFIEDEHAMAPVDAVHRGQPARPDAQGAGDAHAARGAGAPPALRDRRARRP